MDWFQPSGEPRRTFWDILFPLGLEWVEMTAFSALIIGCTVSETGIFCQKEKRERKSKFFFKECSYRAMTQPIQTIKHPLLTVVENTAVKSFHAQCNPVPGAGTDREGKSIDHEFYLHWIPSCVGNDTCYGAVALRGST